MSRAQPYIVRPIARPAQSFTRRSRADAYREAERLLAAGVEVEVIEPEGARPEAASGAELVFKLRKMGPGTFGDEAIVERQREAAESQVQAERSVTDAAVLLHMAATGAYQPVDDLVHEAASWLRGRLASWSPSVASTKRFDDAVRAVLEIAIEEYDRECKP